MQDVSAAMFPLIWRREEQGIDMQRKKQAFIFIIHFCLSLRFFVAVVILINTANTNAMLQSYLFNVYHSYMGLPRICLPVYETQETRALSLGWEGPLEEEMATYSSILAWKIPWTE